MTYLRRIDITRASEIKAEETFPISEQGYMVGNYYVVQNVRYYWLQEQVNCLCPSHICKGAEWPLVKDQIGRFSF